MIGDQHNFGRRTIREKSANGCYGFLKPRSVYWEWFFAGKNSPLSKLFFENEELNRFFGNIFSLEVRFINNESCLFDSCGEVDEIVGASLEQAIKFDDKLTETLFLNFGSLCSYAYSFGISDLNFENLIIDNKASIIPVDIESVFLNPIFLCDTAMVSAGGEFRDKGCFTSRLRMIEKNMEDYLPYALDGFYKGIQAILNNERKIQQVLELNYYELSKSPIRMILRATQLYYAWRIKYGFEKKPSTDEFQIQELLKDFNVIESELIPEEVKQLENGDYPYFYTSLYDPNIQFVSSARGEKSYVESKKGKKLISQFKVPSIDLKTRFSKKRLSYHFLPVGLMEIIWDILPRDYIGNFSTEFLKISITEYSIRIDDLNSKETYIADRSYDPNNPTDTINARLGIVRKK